MALLYAEDFQCLGVHTSIHPSAIGASYTTGTLSYAMVMQQIVKALGFDFPRVMYYANGQNNLWNVAVTYAPNKGALVVQSGHSPEAPLIVNPVVNGLQRQFNYSGDTVRFGFYLTIAYTSAAKGGDFLFFDDMYKVGIDVAGNYTLNGVSTDTPAVFGIDTPIFHEIVFTPTHMELWIGKTKIAEQDRVSVPVKKCRLSATHLAGDTTPASIFVHSYIVVDNTGTFTGPLGRSLAKTYPAAATGVIESTVSANPANSTALSVITKIVQGNNAETAGLMVGSLISPNEYVTNAFTATKSLKTPVAAIANIQAKRRSPSADGMAPFPYLKIAGVKVVGTPVLPSSLWNVFSTEIPITPAQEFTDFEFGYTHDYIDMNKVFISDKDGVEVYANTDRTVYALRGGDLTANVPTVSISTLANDSFGANVPDYSTVPTLTKVELTNTSSEAYVLSYMKSVLETSMTTVNNLTYEKDQ